MFYFLILFKKFFITTYIKCRISVVMFDFLYQITNFNLHQCRSLIATMPRKMNMSTQTDISFERTHQELCARVDLMELVHSSDLPPSTSSSRQSRRRCEIVFALLLSLGVVVVIGLFINSIIKTAEQSL